VKLVRLTVNGRSVCEHVAPRTHLADFLRERMNLTATHLRCEQGACGACTLFIDGKPARSCITYTVMCDGAIITTIEGLEDDAVMAALRQAFSEEHALQCGYCTPGMLVTAHDVVMRLPDADQQRIRLELSGNLCRCTGYVGIVRAISRVLDERRGGLPALEHRPTSLGPVGSRPVRPTATRTVDSMPAYAGTEHEPSSGNVTLGLGSQRPNVEIRHSFAVSWGADDVWAFFADVARVVRCLPGASLMRPPTGEHVYGNVTIKLGPINANFVGQARIVRDETRRRGLIMGVGQDRSGLSRASGEVEYSVEADAGGGTRIALTIRALLVGPLAQFGRGAIVEDLLGRITERFACNLEASLGGTASSDGRAVHAPLQIGSLFLQIIRARVLAFFTRLFRLSKV
jgi:aerobic carbon-monoxide dehydrogenase small subunit